MEIKGGLRVRHQGYVAIVPQDPVGTVGKLLRMEPQCSVCRSITLGSLQSEDLLDQDPAIESDLFSDVPVSSFDRCTKL